MINQKINEKFVIQIWQYQPKCVLTTDLGNNIRVVFPGRLSTGQGCDFDDAIIDIDGTVISGRIEVHVKSSHWFAHGHHKDSKYNDIVLHVVMWNDLSKPVVLHNGHIIPTVCLHSLFSVNNNINSMKSMFNRNQYICPDIQKYRRNKYLIDTIYTAGQERFNAKVARLMQSLSINKMNQVLYYFIARALGYEKNSVPFGKLAELLPIEVLENNKYKENEFNRALLLGTAGLLPSQRVYKKGKFAWDLETTTVEQLWFSNERVNIMNCSEWSFQGVRPLNYPVRRVVALGYLVNYYNYTSFAQGILASVRESCMMGDIGSLVKAVAVPGTGYWAKHFDFGNPYPKNAAILGNLKAYDIVINVLLPFAQAWAKLNGDSRLKNQISDMYMNASFFHDNQITRFMKQQLLIHNNQKLTAPMQQGLIHIFHQFCRSRNCHQCIVANARN